MKIIQIINVRWYNATAWYAVLLSSLLQKAGHDVLIVTIKNSPADKKAKELGIKTVYGNLNSVNPFTILYTSIKLLTLLRSFKPNIVNCHRGEFVIFWALAKMILPYKLIRTRGDQRLPQDNIPNKVMHTYSFDGIVATNSYMAKAFETVFSLPKERIHTILGGVNQEVFSFSQEKRELLRKQYSFTEDSIVLGIVGRFDWVKGQREVIAAVGEIYSENNNTALRLLLVGFSSGIEQEQIEQWVQEAGIEQITTITGHCEDIPGHICVMDIAMIASLGSETIARVALEILSCQRPLLATDVGVMPDLLPKKYLISVENEKTRTKNIKNAIVHCLSSPHYLQELLDVGNITRGRISDSIFLKETIALYSAIVTKK
ncbi:MAG: glycosyltransferase [Desulfovibrionaceae bacterium]